jgi:GT2 family glycosyltransferase
MAKIPRPKLSVIIPTYNGRLLLEECLESVFRYRPPACEVVVVDDGSTDDTSSWVRRTYGDEVRLVRLPQNRGFCAAINAGIRAARGPIVETLNNDALVTEGWADEPVRILETRSEVAAVAPLVWLRDLNGCVDSAGDDYHICGWAINRWHRQPWREALAVEEEVFAASASAAFYRRDALIWIGGFLEHFVAYCDDTDVSFRLRWAGYRVLYCPRSHVYHRLHGSYSVRSPRVLRQIGRNEELLFWINMPTKLLLIAWLPHLAYVTGTLLAQWPDFRRAAALMAGRLSVVRHLPWILHERRRRQLLAEEAQWCIRLPVARDYQRLARYATHVLLRLVLGRGRSAWGKQGANNQGTNAPSGKRNATAA